MTQFTRVDRMDPSKENSPTTGPIDEESTVLLDGAAKACQWNGQAFPDGAMICAEGTAYECSFGKWVKQKDGC